MNRRHRAIIIAQRLRIHRLWNKADGNRWLCTTTSRRTLPHIRQPMAMAAYLLDLALLWACRLDRRILCRNRCRHISSSNIITTHNNNNNNNEHSLRLCIEEVEEEDPLLSRSLRRYRHHHNNISNQVGARLHWV